MLGEVDGVSARVNKWLGGAVRVGQHGLHEDHGDHHAWCRCHSHHRCHSLEGTTWGRKPSNIRYRSGTTCMYRSQSCTRGDNASYLSKQDPK